VFYSALLLERLMISSDEFYVHVCEKCGLLAWDGMCQVKGVPSVDCDYYEFEKIAGHNAESCNFHCNNSFTAPAVLPKGRSRSDITHALRLQAIVSGAAFHEYCPQVMCEVHYLLQHLTPMPLRLNLCEI
jgi:hypothetical protein